MGFSSGLVVAAIISIWLLLLVNVVLTIAGYRYYIECEKKGVAELRDEQLPTVSIMVPAHNEAKVIVRTAEALLRFDYPEDKYEIIIINDNSSDDSAALLEEVKRKNPGRK